MENKKLYILTYDHGGYVLWKDEVKPRLKKIYEWMEKYPGLKIGLDYESFTFDEFSRCDSEIVELCADLLKKFPDRVGLGATTYGQPLSLSVSEESNARQLTYAVRTNMEYFGKTPSVYAISEFALNNQTPQLISLCGYEAAILRSHVMGYGYPRTFDSAWGNWIGKDKTAIPAVPTYDKQGRGFNCCTYDNWILSRWPRDTKDTLEDFKDMFSKYEPLLATRYDDLTQDIEDVTAYAEDHENYQHILLEEIPELYGTPTDELVTTDNDFHVQMPWGYCGNEIFNGVREAEVSVVQAEKLNALSVMLGGKAENEKLDEAWKYALAAEHHDVTICGLLDLSRRFIPASLKASDEVKEKSLGAIAEKIGGDGVLAVNAHSFEVDEWIDAFGEKVNVKLQPFTAEIIKLNQETYTYSWLENIGVLETPCYKIKLSDKGIEYIDCKKDNKRIIDNGVGELFSAVVEGAECVSNGKWQVEIDPQGALAVQTGNIGTVKYRFEMRFNGNSDRIDCKSQFEVHGEKVGRNDVKMGLKSSNTVNGHMHEGKLCFNMNLCLDKTRKMIRDLPYSISEWSGDIRKTENYWYKDDVIIYDEKVSAEESFENITQLNGIYWLCLRDEKQGLAVMNRGCMGSSVKGNYLSIPLLYSNDYLCGTRILDGTFCDEFAILPFNSSLDDIDIHRRAVSYAYQPETIIVSGKSTADKFCAFDFKSDGDEVVLTTLYPENGGIMARFCNYSDNDRGVVLTSDFGRVTYETDLLGNKMAPVLNGKLNFRGWEIKTVFVEDAYGMANC